MSTSGSEQRPYMKTAQSRCSQPFRTNVDLNNLRVTLPCLGGHLPLLHLCSTFAFWFLFDSAWPSHSQGICAMIQYQSLETASCISSVVGSLPLVKLWEAERRKLRDWFVEPHTSQRWQSLQRSASIVPWAFAAWLFHDAVQVHASKCLTTTTIPYHPHHPLNPS